MLQFWYNLELGPAKDLNLPSAQKIQTLTDNHQLSIADGLYGLAPARAASLGVYDTGQASCVIRSHLSKGGRQSAVQQRRRLAAPRLTRPKSKASQKTNLFD